MKYTRAKADANIRYDLKTYTQELFKLRTEDDAEIVASIKAAKEQGISKRQWLRDLYYSKN